MTLRVGHVSSGSLIIHARVIINHFLRGRYSFSRIRYSRGSRPGYRPRTAAGFGPPAGRTLIGPGSRPSVKPPATAGFAPPAGRTLIGPGRRPSVKPPATAGIFLSPLRVTIIDMVVSCRARRALPPPYLSCIFFGVLRCVRRHRRHRRPSLTMRSSLQYVPATSPHVTLGRDRHAVGPGMTCRARRALRRRMSIMCDCSVVSRCVCRCRRRHRPSLTMLSSLQYVPRAL